MFDFDIYNIHNYMVPIWDIWDSLLNSEIFFYVVAIFVFMSAFALVREIFRW